MSMLKTPGGLVSLALLISFTAIAIALGLEHIGGYLPCELCYKGRISHYVGVPLLLLTLAWGAAPYRKMYPMIAFTFLIYGYSLAISVYHAGAEWKFWDGPTACGSLNLKSGVNAADLLQAIQKTQMVSCTEPAFRILGVSLSGMNALVCLAVMALLAMALLKIWRQRISKWL
ncbi:disulfide bond formation protein B [Mesorhizobium sp. SP-1A]|uniref:disulfide bond formation protein B n=1 Tax=Mesorhizobium sp. SP-1A TaxID=3077840 RepID=UPI0028F71B7A|nr:disulfide bond formation protein B [Mesorhizobium sp. SP-1A]